MKKVLALLVCAVLVSACTTPGKRTAIGAGAGAALGAAAGAIIANNTGGKSSEGAIYGALAGAAAGGRRSRAMPAPCACRSPARRPCHPRLGGNDRPGNRASRYRTS